MIYNDTLASCVYCKSLALIHPFLIQRLATMIPGTVEMPSVSYVEADFHSHYNRLTLVPQDVLNIGCQIVSGMVRKEHHIYIVLEQQHINNNNIHIKCLNNKGI